MFDLKPRVHFQEIELSGTVEQKLDGAGANIIDGARGGDCRFAHCCSQVSRNRRRRRLLDDFLMPALHGAIALAEMDHIAVPIGEDLKLDVAAFGDRAFEDQFAGAERARGLRTRAR